MGLMWGNGESVNSLLNSEFNCLESWALLIPTLGLRDTCEQDDGMIYGWSSYDVRTGGVQVINDTKNHVDIITKFIKTTDGNSWGVQVHGIPREDAGKSLRTAVIFHVAIEDATIQGRDQDVRTMKCVTSDQKELFAECSGNDLLLGKFSIKALDAGQNKAAGEPAIISIHADDSRIWQAKGGRHTPMRTVWRVLTDRKTSSHSTSNQVYGKNLEWGTFISSRWLSKMSSRWVHLVRCD